MTVRAIQIYPTCDIHLLLDHPVTTYQLEVRDRNPDGDGDVTDSASTRYRDFETAVAEVSGTGLITPKAVGETFCRIRHTDTRTTPAPPETFVSEVVIRIRVHRRIDKLWFGNNRATVVEDQDNYVLSVYAKFDDGTVGDVSGHPYLTFTSFDTTRVEVGSNLDPEPDPGRLSAAGVTGATAVTVAVRVGAVSDQVPVFVEPAFSTTPRPLLERIHGAGPATDRRNLLFVAEGFSAGDAALFRRLVVLLKDQLFSSKLNSPYDLLKDRFNVWMAFDPSPEEGATCGDWVDIVDTAAFGLHQAKCVSDIDVDAETEGHYTLRELVRRVGLPDRYRPIPATSDIAAAAWASTVAGTDFTIDKLEDTVFGRWKELFDYRLLQARDSRFGQMNGARYGDRDSTRVDPTEPPSRLIEWYDPPDQSHVLSRDRRRMDRSWRARAFIQEYLEGLRLRGGGAADVSFWSDQDNDVARDRGLIVFLVNSALDGGARSVGLAVSTRQNKRFTQVHLTGDETDHSLPPFQVLQLPALVGSSLDEMVSVLAHELAHAFSIGDEYEGKDYGPSHHVLTGTNLNARRLVENEQNLTHHFVIQPAAPAGHRIIDVTNLKWRRWHRVARCSELIANPVPLGGGRLRIQILRTDRAKWDRGDMHNIEVFLRSRTINADRALPPSTRRGLIIEGPLKILTIEADGTCVLASTTSTRFRKGDILYLPELNTGDPLTVFHPDILAGLETSGQPFALKTDVTTPNNGAAYPPEVLVRGFAPRHPAYVVGVYDGGRTYNSRVYRSSGMCKMRDQGRDKVIEVQTTIDPDIGAVTRRKSVKRFMPFCYVCRYALVNEIDPARLAGLAYPI